MEQTTLSTRRLLLRPFLPQDADAVYAACQDPEIPRWTPVPSPYTHQHARTFVSGAVDDWLQDTAYNFALVTSDGGRFVGAMGLVRLQLLRAPERQAELGYWTARGQRGQGYTAEAGRAVARWAFEELGVERLEWLAAAGNVASRAVARSIGFTMEGTLRSRIEHNGTRRDAWIGSLLPHDLGVPSATPYLPYRSSPPAAG